MEKKQRNRPAQYLLDLLSNIALLLSLGLLALVGFALEGQAALTALGGYALIGAVIMLVMNVRFCRRMGTVWFALNWLFMLAAAAITCFVQYGITLAAFGVNSKNLFVPVFAAAIFCVIVTVASVVIQIVMAAKRHRQ